jgi:hypothetical protein
MLSDDEFRKFKNMAEHGAKAKNHLASAEWSWFKETVLGALSEEAVMTLRRAKDDAERLKAQQMFLAASKPEEMLQQLVRQGDAAVMQLTEISTLMEAENGTRTT